MSVEAESERRTTLELVARALGREAHVLADNPSLVWQQLHNRLQWEDDPVASRVAAERVARSRPGGLADSAARLTSLAAGLRRAAAER